MNTDIKKFRDNLDRIVVKLTSNFSRDVWANVYPPQFVESKVSNLDKNALFVRQNLVEWLDDILLYINIPFCNQKCDYCAYWRPYSINKFWSNNYLNCLLKEIDLIKGKNKKKRLKVIYLWWWTPTIFSPQEFKILFDKLKSDFIIDSNTTTIVEVAPYVFTKKHAEVFAEIWVNKPYIWVQTFNEKYLKTINRPQRNKQVYNTVKWLREAGIKFVHFDLIYWFNDESLEDYIKDNIIHIQALKPDSLTLFELHHYQKYPNQIKKFEFDINYLRKKYDLPVDKSEYRRQRHIFLDPVVWVWLWAWSLIRNKWKFTKIWNAMYKIDLYKDMLENNDPRRFISYTLSVDDSIKRYIIRNLIDNSLTISIYEDLWKDNINKFMKYIDILIENWIAEIKWWNVVLSKNFEKKMPFCVDNYYVNYFIMCFVYLFSSKVRKLVLELI